MPKRITMAVAEIARMNATINIVIPVMTMIAKVMDVAAIVTAAVATARQPAPHGRSLSVRCALNPTPCTKGEPMTINTENFKRILALVERSADATGPDRIFDYKHWLADLNDTHKTVADYVNHPCNTIGCLGGWGVVLRMMDEGNISESPYSSSPGKRFQNRDANIDEIIMKLKHIIETGKVIDREFDSQFDHEEQS
jgi:hypothetical protein